MPQSEPSPQQPPQTAEVEPITCWWKTTTGSVRVGEPFGLILTCAIVETETVRVVPDESRLDPAVVQLPPFDVIAGRRADALAAPASQQRFFQYEYTLRLIAEQAFDQDVRVPALQIAYRVEQRRAPGESAQGREQIYAMPPLAMRLQSTVPAAATAADLRDLTAPPFTSIERVAFRGRLLRIVAIGLLTLGVLLIVRAALASRRGRMPAADAALAVPVRAILARVCEELDEVRAARAAGVPWDGALAARTLAPLRIAASHAIGRTLAQQPARAESAAPSGQLLVHRRSGAAGAAATLVSGSAGAADLRRALEANTLSATPSSTLSATPSATLSAASTEAATALVAALDGCTIVSYGRPAAAAHAMSSSGEHRAGGPDAPAARSAVAPDALDAALDESLRAVRLLAAEHTWMAGLRDRLRAGLRLPRGARWAR